MVNNHQIKNQHPSPYPSQNSPVAVASRPSRLEAFTLDFEYNKTLQEIKRDTRRRTHKQA